MNYKTKVVLCDHSGAPLYWQWAPTARAGDTISWVIPEVGQSMHPWTPIPARPAGQVTAEEWAKVDPLLGQAYREFGLRASDLVMQAYRLGRGDGL